MSALSTTPAAAESGNLTTLEDSASKINAEHDLARRHAETAIDHARRCGRLLVEAKAKVAHGGWLPWLAANYSNCERTAQNYMRIAAHRLGPALKSDTDADLTIREALRLLGCHDDRQQLVGGFPLPPLVPGKMIVGAATDTVVLIWHRCDRYFYVAIYKALGTDDAHVAEAKRGIIDHAVPLVVNAENITLAEPWIVQDAIEPTPLPDDHAIWMVAAHVCTRRWRSEAEAAR